MAKEKLEMIVEGGAAKADPSIMQKLGPLKINIADVLKKVNEKTAAFKGMKVPVKLTLDTSTKQITEIEVGTPPTSELIKKELGLEKGAATPHVQKIGNLAMEQIVKIANMKKDSMFANSFKAVIKTVIGSCNSMGVLVEGKEPSKINEQIDKGKYDDIINAQKTEVAKEKMLK